MKLDQGKRAVRETEEKCGYPQVSAVVEQRQKAAIQPAQGPDAQHHIQQQECSRSERANQQRLGRCTRVEPGAYTNKTPEVQRQQRQECDVVYLLLPVPTDRTILNAHGNFSTTAVSKTVW